jgi:hypothetical protein
MLDERCRLTNTLDPSIPQTLQDLIAHELERDEQVTWSGMPKPVFFSGPTLGAFLFAIPWTIFVVVFWSSWNDPNGQGVALIFVVPFFLVGLGMLSAPIWNRRKAQKTAYVITDQRAITFDGGWSMTIRSYPPDKLADVFRKERRDGTGDVIISRKAWRNSDGDRNTEELGFLRVANAKAVESELKKLAEQCVGPEATDEASSTSR